MDTIKLGDTVKDVITELQGVVIARVEYLNGCVRFSVQPKGLNESGEPFKSQYVDEEQLIVLRTEVVVDSAEVSDKGPGDGVSTRTTPPSF